jgi:hypothetical protein
VNGKLVVVWWRLLLPLHQHLDLPLVFCASNCFNNPSTKPTMSAELQTARDQLALVNLSLEADPTNDEFLKLKVELVELIDLIQGSQPVAAPSKSAPSENAKGKAKAKEINWQDVGPYKAGMDCMAKYKDGKL